MSRHTLSTGRKLQLTIASILLFTIIIVGLAEVGFRAALLWRGLSYPTKTTEVDTYLGWKAVSNFNFEGSVEDANGEKYHLHITTDANGFRYFNQPIHSLKRKILFIGDSYTHAIEVSNDKTYYGLLKEELEQHSTSIYAYGTRGFGPLQLQLWLDEWYDKIQPDLIVWQFCFNDIYNSSYLLEKQSYYNNNRRTRPYLEGEKIVYNNPARLGLTRIRNNLKFIDFVLTRIELFVENKDHLKKIASEDLIEANGNNYSPYAETLTNINTIIQKVKTKTKQVPIIAFSVDNKQPYSKDLSLLFKQNGIPVIDQIPLTIEALQQKGEVMYAKDGAHWNEKGHAVAAKALRPHLLVEKNYSLLKNTLVTMKK